MNELQQLRDRVAELEDILGLTAQFPRELIPVRHYRRGVAGPLLGLLLARPFVSADVAYDTLYGGRPEADQPKSGNNCVSVMIYHLRQTLAPHGITVRNLWGQGYYLDDADKEKLRALIALHQASRT